MKKSAQLKCLTICSLICRSAAERRRLKAAVGNRFGGGSMKDHENNEQRQGGPLVSMCYSAGTGSSVLDPFPSVVVASLRAVDHRCCTPLHVTEKGG